MNAIDFVIRNVGRRGFLPLIVVSEGGRELYRGSIHLSPGAALEAAMSVWLTDGTSDVAAYKAGRI